MAEECIIIPDLHGRRFWRDAVKGHGNDPIVFLGDYLDPYSWEDITPGDAYRELRDVIDFKLDHMDNVTLLLGNHDLGYLDSSVCCCRRDEFGAERNRKLLEDNLELFNLTRTMEIAGMKILFSHAGIHNGWLRNNRSLFGTGNFSPEVLNTLLHDKDRRDELMAALCDVSMYRGGGDPAGSVVWADVNEYYDNDGPLPGYIQVVGHTQHPGGPVEVDGKLWCLDCARAFSINDKGQIGQLM